MKYSKVIESIKKQVGFTPKQKDLCVLFNMNPSAISARAARDTEFSEDEIKILEKEYNITLRMENDCICVNYYPDVIASCGVGGFVMSQECVSYNVPAALFRPSKNVKGYSMCHAKGNSMYPRIWDGDFVICEHKENMKIENGEIYIFCFDEQIYLKRLTKNINQIVVESENPDFPTQYIEREQMNELHLIGHVICSGRLNGMNFDRRN